MGFPTTVIRIGDDSVSAKLTKFEHSMDQDGGHGISATFVTATGAEITVKGSARPDGVGAVPPGVVALVKA